MLYIYVCTITLVLLFIVYTYPMTLSRIALSFSPRVCPKGIVNGLIKEMYHSQTLVKCFNNTEILV